MSAVAREPASPEPPVDPPVVHGALRILGLVSLVLGGVAAVVAFVTPVRPPSVTAVLAAIGVVSVGLGFVVQVIARRTGHRASGAATAGLMLGIAALGILAVTFVPAAVGIGMSR